MYMCLCVYMCVALTFSLCEVLKAVSVSWQVLFYYIEVQFIAAMKANVSSSSRTSQSMLKMQNGPIKTRGTLP